MRIDDMMEDRNGDGIPDGAEVTKKIAAPDGSITTAKWTKGAAEPRKIDNADAGGWWFDPSKVQATNDARAARMASEGYNLDAMAQGSNGMDSMAPYRRLGPDAQDRIFSGARTIEDRAAYRTEQQKRIDDMLKGDQARADRFALAKMEQDTELGKARIDAASKRQMPQSQIGSSGALIWDPRTGTYRTEWKPEQQVAEPLPPGSRGMSIPDPNAPGGRRVKMFPEEASPKSSYVPLVIGGQ